MSRNRTLRDEGVKTAAAQAAALSTKRLTCEGCAHLRAFRPMCQAEDSDHYRQPRHTGSDACKFYNIGGRQAIKPAAPETPRGASA